MGQILINLFTFNSAEISSYKEILAELTVNYPSTEPLSLRDYTDEHHVIVTEK